MVPANSHLWRMCSKAEATTWPNITKSCQLHLSAHVTNLIAILLHCSSEYADCVSCGQDLLTIHNLLTWKVMAVN